MFFAELILFIIIGLILGSFASAIAHREPHNIPWWKSGGEQKRSACTSCNKVLSSRDLIPVFSWLAAGGKCRQCGEKISPVYPLMELGCALAAAATYLFYDFSITSLFILCAIPFLAALLLIDLRHMILPNRLVLILGGLGFIRLIVEGFVFQTIDPVLIGANYVLASFVYAALAWGLGKFIALVLKKEALGMGDVKFFAVAGLWLGLTAIADFCVLSGVFGVVLALIWKRITKESVFPFGPALILSFYVLLLVDGSLFG